MKTILVILVSCFLGLGNLSTDSNNSIIQNCSAELKVEKDRNFQSADEDGASFVLLLENTGSSASTFQLDTRNISGSCSAQNKAPGSNVDLSSAFQMPGLSNHDGPANEVTLESGQVVQFRVNITVPEGTAYNNWSCIEVSATSTNCGSSAAKTILSIYVPNPSEG